MLNSILRATLCVAAGMTLTACDEAADHPPMAMSAAVAAPAGASPVSFKAPAPVHAASAATWSSGSAALHRHRDDVDPSHAAIASYAD